MVVSVYFFLISKTSPPQTGQAYTKCEFSFERFSNPSACFRDKSRLYLNPLRRKARPHEVHLQKPGSMLITCPKSFEKGLTYFAKYPATANHQRNFFMANISEG